jgi:uncharacterized SAM-binding protein YcdF (DUF218 family)
MIDDANPVESANKVALNPRRRPYRVALRMSAYILLLLAGLTAGGFLRFADTVAGLETPKSPEADAIVVLTGGSQRIEQAVSLLESGTGQRLLISGAHPGTSASRIREMTRAPEGLFDCCVDIGYDAIDTVGNALETARWAKNHGFKSILVVTNNYHMPRSLFELHRVDPNTRYIAYPIVNSDLKTANWMAKPDVVRAILSEYVKLAGAFVRATFLPPDETSLRSTRRTD